MPPGLPSPATPTAPVLGRPHLLPPQPSAPTSPALDPALPCSRAPTPPLPAMAVRSTRRRSSVGGSARRAGSTSIEPLLIGAATAGRRCWDPPVLNGAVLGPRVRRPALPLSFHCLKHIRDPAGLSAMVKGQGQCYLPSLDLLTRSMMQLNYYF
ncbi:hypothetical protein BS78_05G110900 [Paspalum vaginatum]|nr:hypothetical protein BS78_05G110900 [Paspalum vaginatum]